MKLKNIIKEFKLVKEISAVSGLQAVSKGETSSVEGIKLSKEMADAILNWVNTSPYGRKYGDQIKKLRLANLVPTIIGPFGVEKKLPANLKGEFKALKLKYKN
jgi:hypothetical protein